MQSVQSIYRALEPVTIPPSEPKAVFTNWGRTFKCVPLAVFQPETESQCELILELARRERKTVRVVGVGHSPSDLACTNDFMLITSRLDRILEVSIEKNYVVAQAGITLHSLHAQLATHGLAMHNVGSISDQTLAGIITTASHGSGINYGVLSTHTLAVTLLLADGSKVTCSRDERPELFLATICGLGSTGLILSLKLSVEPAFRLKEVQEDRSFEDVIENLDRLVHSAQHVRFWWLPPSNSVRASFSDRTQEPSAPAGSWLFHRFFGFHLVQLILFFGRYFSSLNVFVSHLVTWLVSGYTVGVDDGHRIFNVDCKYPQHTTEWAIPYENTQTCLRELRDWTTRLCSDPNGFWSHIPFEIRFSDKDDIWLSPSTGRKTCWIGIVLYKPYAYSIPQYAEVFPQFEAILSKYGGRPHWAKAHFLTPTDLRRMYPRFDDFVRVLDEVDPEGLFRNDYVQRHIFGAEGVKNDGGAKFRFES